jgi:hypothetical protein
LTELDDILLEFLRDDYDFRSKIEENFNQETLEEKFNKEIYKNFNYDILNRDKVIVEKFKPQTENYLLNYISAEDKQNPNSNFNQFFFKKLAKKRDSNPDNTRDEGSGDDDNNSNDGDFYGNTSFLSKDGDYVEEFNQEPMMSIKTLKGDLYKRKFKDTRLMSKRYNLDFPTDHKPKLMTTNKCR